MADVKTVIHSGLVPALQLSLGLFLIMKTTPLWAVIHCSIAYFLDCISFPYTDYKQLRGFQGRVFKKVISHVTTAGEVSNVEKPRCVGDMNIAESAINGGPASGKNGISGPHEKWKKEREEIKVVYLGQKFVVEREGEGEGEEEKMMMSLKDDHGAAYSYCITPAMWETVKYIEKLLSSDAPGAVFVTNYKEIWEEVLTGDIMEFEQVLDSVILDNRAIVRVDQDYFLPVNLLLTEDKLRATLNFVGMFLQTQKQVHWGISTSMSLTAALLGFSTTLRLSLIGWVDKRICRGLQFVCDLLPFAMRRSIYCWTSWVPGLKPSNDIQAKIIKGDVLQVLVAGGAKFHSHSHLHRITFADSSVDYDVCSEGGPFLFRCHPPSSDTSPDLSRHSVYIEWIFQKSKCSLKVGRVSLKDLRSRFLKATETFINGDGKKKKAMFFKYDDSDHHSGSVAVNITSRKEKESVMADGIHIASVDIDCRREEGEKLFIFASFMAELNSGSLKSHHTNSRNVYVRRFIESINAYVRSGYPPLHKLELKGVVVR